MNLRPVSLVKLATLLEQFVCRMDDGMIVDEFNHYSAIESEDHDGAEYISLVTIDYDLDIIKVIGMDADGAVHVEDEDGHTYTMELLRPLTAVELLDEGLE